MKAWKFIAVVCGLFFLLIPPFLSGAQDPAEKWDFKNVKKVEAEAPTPPSVADQLTHEFRMTQERYKLYECVILSIAVVVCLLILLRFISRTHYSATHIVHAAGLVFIIFGTIFVVILSDVDQQLTGAMGILGAVAGYLFGTMRRGGESGSEASASEQGKGK